MPGPSGDQTLPSHRATRLAATPPAVANWPPATTSPFGSAASARTTLSVPLPSGDHVVPFQRATLLAATPAIDGNEPAITRSPPASTASARTSYVAGAAGSE